MYAASISHFFSSNLTGITPRFDILHDLVFVFLTIFAIVSLSNVDPLFAQTSTANQSEQGSTTSTNEIKTFRDSKTDVSIQYPSDWEVASDEYVDSIYGDSEGVIALMLPKSLDGSTLLIAYEELPFSMSAKEYAQASKKSLPEDEEASLSEAIPISIGSLDGYNYNVTMYAETYPNGVLVQTHIVFVENSKAYFIAYNLGATDTTQDLEDIESMLDSFKLENVAKDEEEAKDDNQNENLSTDQRLAVAKVIVTRLFDSLFPESGEKFTNADHGVEIAFPKNWTGFEMKVVPMAVVSPEGFNFTNVFSTVANDAVNNIAENIDSNNKNDLSEQKKQELTDSLSNNIMEYFENAISTMSVVIYDKELTRLMNSVNPNSTISVDSLTSLYELVGASDSTVNCDRKTLEYITLNNNISTEMSTEQCLLTTNNKKEHNINYFVLTPNAIIQIQYMSDMSNKENYKFLPEFEESLKSLSIKEPLPINNQTIQQFLTG